MAAILFAWNLTYALKPKVGPVEQIDNVAIVAFIVTAFFIPVFRFLRDFEGKET